MKLLHDAHGCVLEEALVGCEGEGHPLHRVAVAHRGRPLLYEHVYHIHLRFQGLAEFFYICISCSWVRMMDPVTVGGPAFALRGRGLTKSSRCRRMHLSGLPPVLIEAKTVRMTA